MESPKRKPAGTSKQSVVKKADQVNVIVTCPKGFRCFRPADKTMLYEAELISLGVAMSPLGILVHVPTGAKVSDMFPLWNTSQQDDLGNALYEGDICEIGVDTGFGSLTQRVGIMRWSPEQNNFSVHFNGRQAYSGNVSIKACRKIGNEFQDVEAGKRYQNDNE